VKGNDKAASHVKVFPPFSFLFCFWYAVRPDWKLITEVQKWKAKKPGCWR